jgi:hypothetical protein
VDQFSEDIADDDDTSKAPKKQNLAPKELNFKIDDNNKTQLALKKQVEKIQQHVTLSQEAIKSH